jgi:hypothetical protein
VSFRVRSRSRCSVRSSASATSIQGRAEVFPLENGVLFVKFAPPLIGRLNFDMVGRVPLPTQRSLIAAISLPVAQASMAAERHLGLSREWSAQIEA